jgi:hypothetical protein
MRSNCGVETNTSITEKRREEERTALWGALS